MSCYDWLIPEILQTCSICINREILTIILPRNVKMLGLQKSGRNKLYSWFKCSKQLFGIQWILSNFNNKNCGTWVKMLIASRSTVLQPCINPPMWKFLSRCIRLHNSYNGKTGTNFYCLLCSVSHVPWKKCAHFINTETCLQKFKS